MLFSVALLRDDDFLEIEPSLIFMLSFGLSFENKILCCREFLESLFSMEVTVSKDEALCCSLLRFYSTIELFFLEGAFCS